MEALCNFPKRKFKPRDAQKFYRQLINSLIGQGQKPKLFCPHYLIGASNLHNFLENKLTPHNLHFWNKYSHKRCGEKTEEFVYEELGISKENQHPHVRSKIFPFICCTADAIVRDDNKDVLIEVKGKDLRPRLKRTGLNIQRTPSHSDAPADFDESDNIQLTEKQKLNLMSKEIKKWKKIGMKIFDQPRNKTQIQGCCEIFGVRELKKVAALVKNPDCYNKRLEPKIIMIQETEIFERKLLIKVREVVQKYVRFLDLYFLVFHNYHITATERQKAFDKLYIFSLHTRNRFATTLELPAKNDELVILNNTYPTNSTCKKFCREYFKHNPRLSAIEINKILKTNKKMCYLVKRGNLRNLADSKPMPSTLLNKKVN